MADVFLSYSRRDTDFVRRLHAALAAGGRDSWVDWEGIPPTAEWLKEVYANIDGADSVVFVLSPDFLASEVCGRELAHAAASKKRLVPLVCRDVSASAVPLELRELNWIFFRPEDDFDAAFRSLVTALDTDLGYVHLSTRLLVRAREWEDKEHNAGFALHGGELDEAERWLADGADKRPAPTALQTQFITASRRAASGRLRRLLGGAVTAVVLLVLLSITALTQSQIAQTQRAAALSERAAAVAAATTAQARALAAEADLALAQNQPDLALLLSDRALQVDDTYTTRDSLLGALQYSPHLETALQPPFRVPAKDVGGGVTGLAFGAGGRVLLAANGNRDAHITRWDVATHQVQAVFPGPFKRLLLGWTFALSADGTRAVTAGPDGVRLWDAGAGVQLAQLAPDCLIPGAFSPDGAIQQQRPGCAAYSSVAMDAAGATAFAADGTGQVVAWSTQSDQVVARYVAPDALVSPATALAVSAEGRYLAMSVCARDGAGASCAQPEIWLWDVATGVPLHPPLVGHTDAIRSLAFSPDGTLLASGSDDDSVRLWQVATGQSLGGPLRGHSGAVTGVAFSPDGALLASGGDTTVRLWDVADQRPAAVPFVGHEAPVTSVAFSPDGLHLASGDADGGVLLWNARIGSALSRRIFSPAAASPVFASAAAFSPDGKVLAIGVDGPSKSIRLLDPATGRTSATLPLDDDKGVGPIAFSRDGTRLAALEFTVSANGDETNTVVVWDLATGRRLRQLDAPGAAVALTFGADADTLATSTAPLGFSPDGETLAASGSTVVWDVGTGDVTRRLPASAAGSVALWDVRTGKARGQIHAAGLADEPFSPDGHLLATLDPPANATDPLTLTLWDTRTLRPSGAPVTIQHGGRIADAHAAFSPDGRLIAVTLNATVLVWNVAARDWQARALQEPDGAQFGAQLPYESPTFSGDGTQLAVTDFKGVTIWTVGLSAWRANACAEAGRNLSVAEWDSYVPGAPYSPVCPTLPPHPSLVLQHLTQANDAEGHHDGRGASAEYARAATLAVPTDDALLNDAVCWMGAMGGAARQVLAACDRAVALAPADGAFHDSRAVARALTGEAAGAASDLQAFVAWASPQTYYTEAQPDGTAPYVTECQAWATALAQGQDPFDAATLARVAAEKWYTSFYDDAPPPIGFSSGK